jgi:hypothetical protein
MSVEIIIIYNYGITTSTYNFGYGIRGHKTFKLQALINVPNNVFSAIHKIPTHKTAKVFYLA